MRAQEIQPGLYRWTAAHPEWNARATPGGPDDWPEVVGSVLYELPDIVVLIDPLIPAGDREEFLAWLDGLVASRPVTILTTIRWHRRDREQLAERYEQNTTRAWNVIPSGVEPHPLSGAAETLFWLPGALTLVAGDRLIGAPAGGLSLCPQSWLSQVRVDRPELADLLRPLLELPIERVLPSHGDPVLRDGRAALARAIAQADPRDSPFAQPA
jgi:hypothetical protein